MGNRNLTLQRFLTCDLVSDKKEPSKGSGIVTVTGGKEEEDNNNVGAKILKDHMSREAQNILDGLPLLNFMSSSFLNKMKGGKH